MKTNKDYIFRKVAGEGMLVPTGKATQKFNGMINLTDTAAFIWNEINKCESLDEIVVKVLEEYEIDEATARRDVYGFVKSFYEHGLVTDVKEFE